MIFAAPAPLIGLMDTVPPEVIERARKTNKAICLHWRINLIVNRKSIGRARRGMIQA